MVVKGEPGLKAPSQLGDGGVFLEVDLLVFDAPPQPLDENVVHPAAATVHAHFHAEVRQPAGLLHRGELATLVGVEDLGDLTGGVQRLFQSF